MSPIQPGLEAEDTREPRAEQPIVVGIDGSPGAVAALRWAAVEARTHGRRLTAVYAYDPVVYGAPMPPMAGIQDLVVAGGEARLDAVSYTHLRAHETVLDLVCRLLLEKQK